MQVKKQQLEPDMEQWTDSKLGKGHVKTVYCHPAYLTYMQSTSWERQGWMNHKLESRLLGKISTDMQMICRWYADDTTLMAESEEELKSLFMRVKVWKSWLETQYSNNQEDGIWSHYLMANRREIVEVVTDFLFLGSKITADSDCSHEIKRYLLLGRKAVTNQDSELKSRVISLPTKVCIC